MKNFSVLFFLLCSHVYCFCQQVKINYGNNPKAGKYYKIRGINMYCEMYGKGKPLLMLHGNGGSVASFHKNIDYFSRHYKVIAVDSRAQGKTMDNKDSLSFEMMADDFAALMDVLKIDSAYVLGWSDGGINAVEMALRHPAKVMKFAATGTNIFPDSTAFAASLWKDFTAEYEKRKNAVLTTAKEKNDWKLFLLDYLQPKLSFQMLQKIKCPVLIIAGDKDLIAVQHTVSIFENIPNGRLWILPNSGHGTLEEYADEFNRKVDAFFR